MTDVRWPYDHEAERSVLGAILVRNEAMDDVLALQARHFHRDAHGAIWRAMSALASRGAAVDILTLKAELGPANVERVGGMGYLTTLDDGLPSSWNVAHYAEAVVEASLRRDLILAAQSAIDAAQRQDVEARALLSDTEARISAIGEAASRGELRPVGDIVADVQALVERWAETGTGLSGIASGFYDLDAMTHGWQPQDLVIIAARPSMGKSAFAAQIAEQAARLGSPVAFFSLEMSRESLVLRQAIAGARVNGQRVRAGKLVQADYVRLSDAFLSLERLDMAIDDSAAATVIEIRSKARRMKARGGLGMVVVDYLQLMGHAERAENRTLEVAGFTRGLKAIAKELHVPVIALSQLSRGVESRGDKRPMLSDLRDSGALEQDADVVAMLYRDDYYRADSAEPGVAELILAKQRNGPTGTVKLKWIAEQTRFENLEWRQ